MNSFINGVRDDVNNHVNLNQPTLCVEAAHLREAISKRSGVSNQFTAPQSMQQEQWTKELESNMNLLVSLAGQNKGNMFPPVSTFDQKQSHAADSPLQPATISAVDAPITPGSQKRDYCQYTKWVSKQSYMKETTSISAFLGKWGGACGRHLCTTDRQPICNVCHRVGHVARYCSECLQQSSYATAQPKSPVYISFSPSNKTRSFCPAAIKVQPPKVKQDRAFSMGY